MTTTLNKTHTHIIGFSYDLEVDGELCDFSGEISTYLDEDWIKTCDEDLETSKRYSPCGWQEEWDGTLERVIQHSDEDNYYFQIFNEMESLTWDYTQKIEEIV